MSSPTEAGPGGRAGPGGQEGPPDIADALRDVATRAGTPSYVTDLATLDRAAGAIRDAFPDPWVRQYSIKANDVPEIVAEVASRGFGANVVSRGEWAIARRAGVPNDRITLEGVGKTDADLRDAVRAAATGRPLAWVAVESADEAEVLTPDWPGAPVSGAGRDPRSTCSSGSTRTSRPRRCRCWRSGPGCPSSG